MKNRFFDGERSDNEIFDAALETKFVATSRRSLCVSTRSADDEDDALPAVWVSDFSTTISPGSGAVGSVEKRDVPNRNADYFERDASRWANANGAVPFSATKAGANKSAAIAESKTQADAFSSKFCKPFVPLGLSGMTLPQIERAAILETLLACEGNRRKAARKLGVSEKTIYNKIKIYKLKAELELAFRNVEQAS